MAGTGSFRITARYHWGSQLPAKNYAKEDGIGGTILVPCNEVFMFKNKSIFGANVYLLNPYGKCKQK
jgi:hypothetical protein